MAVPLVIMGVMGRMGSTIAALAQKNPDFSLAGVVERPACSEGMFGFTCPKGTKLEEVLAGAEDGSVVIDFTTPESSLESAETAARRGNPIVIGTTGLSLEQQERLARIAEQGRVFWSPNMSIGVNVLFKILPQLVQLLGETYDMEMVELHHNQKKDAPSGTALKLAQVLAEARDWDLKETGKYCREGIIGARPDKEIGVQTIRGGDVVGVHTVYFLGPGERIEVTHQAHSRENFARGALRAAKWIVNQEPGRLYAMADVLQG